MAALCGIIAVAFAAGGGGNSAHSAYRRQATVAPRRFRQQPSPRPTQLHPRAVPFPETARNFVTRLAGVSSAAKSTGKCARCDIGTLAAVRFGEAAHIHQPQIDGEERPTRHQPQHDQRHIGAEQRHAEEDHAADRIRDGPKRSVNAVRPCLARVLLGRLQAATRIRPPCSATRRPQNSSRTMAAVKSRSSVLTQVRAPSAVRQETWPMAGSSSAYITV